MKRSILLISILLLLINLTVKGQSTPASFTVSGDLDKYYPVIFKDINWEGHKPTVLEIGRSYVHENSDWRGSLMMKITYHITHWGNGSHFINVELKSLRNLFIAGWRDITSGNPEYAILVWMKGGGTTYHYISNSVSMPAPVVYDGTDGRIAYQELNGPLHTYKTSIDAYVNTNGMNYDGDFSINGNLGIGTVAQGAKLAVKGKIIASEIEVKDVSNIPDYVFNANYQLTPIDQLAQFIKAHSHLPEVPSEKEFKEKGMNVAEMNTLLLKKVEEMTLYIIELNKQNINQNKQLQEQCERIKALENSLMISKHK